MAEDGDALLARRVVLARRARFVAAALAGTGLTLGAPAAAKPEEESTEREASECGQDASVRCYPQICLSDMDVEGELVAPPPREEPRSGAQKTTGPLAHNPPLVCLSIAPPNDNLPRQHDGFYLRVNLMPTLVSGAVDGAESTSYAGVGVGAGLAAGMTLLPGGVFGLSLRGYHAPENAMDARFALTSVAMGPMFVYYPDQRAGLFVGGAFEVSVVRMRSTADTAGLAGVGGALWLGYDLWIADDFSLGTALHADFGWARGEVRSQDQRLFTRNLALALSVSWH